MSTDQIRDLALDPDEHPELHQKLLPRNGGILIRDSGPVVSLQHCRSHLSFLRWWYIRSQREHMRMIRLLPKLLRDLKKTERLMTSKKYFPIMKSELDTYIRLQSLCASFNRFKKKWFTQNAEPADVWSCYVNFAERFDHKMDDALDYMAEWDPAVGVAVNITPEDLDDEEEEEEEREDEEASFKRKKNHHVSFQPDPLYQQKEEEEHHAEWERKQIDEWRQKYYNAANPVWKDKEEEEEDKGYDPLEDDPKYPLRKMIPRSAFKVPEVDDKLYGLIHQLKVHEEEDNKDSAQKQEARKDIMQHMQNVVI